MPQGSGTQDPSGHPRSTGRQHPPKGYALHLRYAADNNRESRGKIYETSLHFPMT